MAFLVLFEEGPEWERFLARVRMVREAPPEMPDGELLTIVARAMSVPLASGYLTGPDSRAVRALLSGASPFRLAAAGGQCPGAPAGAVSQQAG